MTIVTQESFNPLRTRRAIDVPLTLTIHNSVRTWIQVMFEGKSRFSIEFSIRVHWLKLKMFHFDRVYGHFNM